MKNKTLIIGIFLFLVVIAGGLWIWSTQAEASSGSELLEANGVIEARQAVLASEVGGLVQEVLVEEGQSIGAGQALVKIDDSLLVAQRQQAQAALRAAEAQLALLEAGAREEQIVAAEAELVSAEAALNQTRSILDTVTAGTQPDAIATTKISLDQAWDQYKSLRVSFTTDQLEEMRSALTEAEDIQAAAEAWRDDVVADDRRHPDDVIQAFEGAVKDARIVVSAAQRAYDASKDDALAYVSQIEMARLSWETARAIETRTKARYDALSDDERTETDTLNKFKQIFDDFQNLVTVTKTAFDELTSGNSGLLLEGAWSEVQRLQAQLDSYALRQLIAAGAVPSVESLLAQIDSAGAQRDMAAANLAALVNGARAEEIVAAQAQVDSAQAQLDALDVQLEKFTTLAPFDGIVLARSVEPGETAFPGTTLLEIGRLDRLELTVYVAEDRLGLVTPGQTARVNVDTYPGQIFAGTVLRISNEAEFTPINIQTEDDRVRLVYAVVISLDNPDLSLKPGMIADVEFGH